ncbi:NAD(P)H-binding protein [Streptomyces luteogriseus]|uniref:NAD(P)H-binding protein n=1 Tax=Streptomyces luteogriseus TaxID=68233 RepID=UPI0037B93DE9
MKLTIVAATGGIGRHLVEQTVAGGHDVTAVARRPRDLPDGVHTVAVDLTRPDMPTLTAAVRGADAGRMPHRAPGHRRGHEWAQHCRLLPRPRDQDDFTPPTGHHAQGPAGVL